MRLGLLASSIYCMLFAFAFNAYSTNCPSGGSIDLGQSSLPGSLNASLTCGDGFPVGDVQVRVTEISKWKWKTDVLFSNASDLTCSVGGSAIGLYAPNGRNTFGNLPSSVEARPHSEKVGEAISDLTNPMYQNIDYPVRFSARVGFGCKPPEKKAAAIQPSGDLISKLYKQDLGYDLTREARLEGCNWHFQSTTDFEPINKKGPIVQKDGILPLADLGDGGGRWDNGYAMFPAPRLYTVYLIFKKVVEIRESNGSDDSVEDPSFYFNSQDVGDRWTEEVRRLAKACGAKLEQSK